MKSRLVLLAVLSGAVVLVAAGAGVGATPPRAAHVEANALVRIDPGTNAISSVIGVGPGPMAVAVSRRSVWVYSDSDRKATEIDVPRTGFAARRPSRRARRPWPSGRPMLAADAGGAWLVGIDEQQGPLLARAGGQRATHAPTR